MQIRQCNLNHSLRRQKEHERIDERPAPILELAAGNDRRHREVQNCRKVDNDINVKISAARIDIVGADGKYKPIGNGQCQKDKIADLAAYRRLKAAPEGSLFVQHIHKAERHCGRQAEA